jgi:hypothetical protein
MKSSGSICDIKKCSWIFRILTVSPNSEFPIRNTRFTCYGLDKKSNIYTTQKRRTFAYQYINSYLSQLCTVLYIFKRGL